jgi:hypothetical protein
MRGVSGVLYLAAIRGLDVARSEYFETEKGR